MNWENEWKCPTMRQRIKPFWFWNGDMNEAEIDRQLREMKEQGLGGAFICARQGQTIAYLNNQWFDRIAFACRKAKEYGLEVWLYDEYPYPSGVSGGEVLLRHPEAGHTVLSIQIYDAAGGEETECNLGWEKVMYAKAVRKLPDGTLDWNDTIDITDDIGVLQPQEIYQKTGLTAYNNKRFFSYGPTHVLNVTLPEGGWRLVICSSKALNDFKYYGNYFDPCNKAAVQTFIETTHEKYQKTLGDEMGKSVYGMFSDEVGLLGRLPWSEQLPAYFEKRFGYDIRSVLAAIGDKTYPDAAKIRYEFYQALHELFRESYHKPMSDWCNEHNILYATEVPSMRRSTQIYSTVPGGDCAHEKLGRSLDWTYERDLHSYRSCAMGVSSVSRQMNRDYAMIESFHSVGWSMTLQDAKWMLDLLASMGINFYNVHAFYYTIDSITKHDAPPSQFLQNPYWKNYHLLADYAGRLSAWLSNTESLNTVAVLDPVVSYWTHLANSFQRFGYAGTDQDEEADLNTLKDDWMHIIKELRYSHIGADLIDTEIMAMAEIADGRMRIGKAEYNTLVITPNTAIERTATEKIKEFLKSGGRVIAIGLLPYEVVDEDEQVEKTYQEIFGVEKDTKADYWQEGSGVEVIRNGNAVFVSTNGNVKHAGSEEKWISLIAEAAAFPVSVSVPDKDRKSLFSSIRRGRDGELYIMLGNYEKNYVDAELSLKEDQSSAWHMSLENAEITGMEMQSGIVKVSLAPFETKLIRFDRQPASAEEKDRPIIIIDTANPMEVSIKGGNIYRMEMFEVSLDRKNWKETEVKTLIELCDASGILTGENLVYDSEFGTPKHIGIKYPVKLYYKTKVEIETLPGKAELLLDARCITGDYVISVNGHVLANRDFEAVFINDQNNRMQDVSAYLKQGENEIAVEVTAEHDWDGIRDPLYLVGDFGVADGRIVQMPKTAALREKYIEGFPYYSGDFIFKGSFAAEPGVEADLRLSCSDEIHDCMEVIVNGETLGVRAFSPNTWHVKPGVLRKENTVEIIYTNTLIHMLEGSYFDYDEHETVKI
ncbi:MAG: hypothetical protein J6B06_00930 [Lachnospiraceae bacterium]|nr:hypothetical protein [Lachnospiraceae bacterium]